MTAIIQKEKVVKELIQGREYTSQLQFLLKNSSASAELDHDDLMVKILTCFSEAISLLGTASDSVATSQVDSVNCRSEDSGESRKRPLSATCNKGSYKRKKTCNSLTKVSSTIEDGHAWRKYGQKDILNAKYPRSYFRCTHKYDKGCKATKHVQRKEDDPKLFHITYIGDHTCSNYCNWDSYSNSTIIGASSSSCAVPTIKKESFNNEDTTATPTHHQSLDWKDFVPFDDHHTATLADVGLDTMELMVTSIEFGTDFQFTDEPEFNYL